jgi:transposase
MATKKTTTCVAALRPNRLIAPCVFDGAINRARFLAHVEQALAPPLRAGDVVVIDDLAAHKLAGVRQASATTGARLL